MLNAVPPPVVLPPWGQNHLVTTKNPCSLSSWLSPGSIGNAECLEDLAPEAFRTPAGRHKTLSRGLQEASRDLKGAPRALKRSSRDLQEHSEASKSLNNIRKTTIFMKFIVGASNAAKKIPLALLERYRSVSGAPWASKTATRALPETTKRA